MSVMPFPSPTSTYDVKMLGFASAAVAVVFAFRLTMPQFAHPVSGMPESRVRMVVSLVLLLLNIGVAVAGCLAVRLTIAAAGDLAPARIQADAVRVASYTTFGAAFIVAPSRYGVEAGIVMDAAGLLIVLIGALIAFETLTSTPDRSRLESEAEQRIAAGR